MYDTLMCIVRRSFAHDGFLACQSLRRRETVELPA